MTGNVLFIVLDQLRADVLSGRLAGAVPTPNLDRLMADGALFTRHFTVTSPCGPARASLLTGLYAHNHGAVCNGHPLDDQHTNIAREVRALGIEPLLFGYTDTQPDPETRHPNDPDQRAYESAMSGFREIVEMRLDEGYEWPAQLKALGYDIPLPLTSGRLELFRPVGGTPGGPAFYAAEHSDTAYLTDETIKALAVRPSPWFAHVTYLRPHPPWIAPAPYHAMFDPDEMPRPMAGASGHALFDAWFSGPTETDMFHGYDGRAQGLTARQVGQCRATYFGLVAELDAHIGRLLRHVEELAGETLIVVTTDHGEMLGDHGMWGKQGVFDSIFHAPLIVRDPRRPGRRRIDEMTESIDVVPTILDWLGADDLSHYDGHSLLPLVAGDRPHGWRETALMGMEFGNRLEPTRFERFTGLTPEDLSMNILREPTLKYVRFGGLPPMLFDLARDPEESTNVVGERGYAADAARMEAALAARLTGVPQVAAR